MRLVVAGVRGSTPAPGCEFAGVGGNTSCIAISPGAGDVPSLLLDAGTGIRAVTALLSGAPFVGTILLSHLHWDHVQGLPFFAAGDREDARVRLLLPDEGMAAADSLRRAMSPPHFPIGPDGLRGRWTFDVIDEGVHEIEGLDVTVREVPHKGGRTFGYRVADGDAAVAYVPDHLPDPGGPGWRAVYELASDVDLFVHDAQFVASERSLAASYGHATVEQAVELAVASGARSLLLFHHAPARTDAELADILASIDFTSIGAPVQVLLAREGDVFDLSRTGSAHRIDR